MNVQYYIHISTRIKLLTIFSVSIEILNRYGIFVEKGINMKKALFTVLLGLCVISTNVYANELYLKQMKKYKDTQNAFAGQIKANLRQVDEFKTKEKLYFWQLRDYRMTQVNFEKDIDAFLASKKLWEWENEYWLKRIGY